MLGKQGDNTDLFQLVTMDTLVPSDHRLRRLHAVLDMSFVCKRVERLYSQVGRRSIDPEVVVRMWVLQYLHGYSERELCDEMLMHAGFRWFCGLSFNDKIPDQSTLVKLRTKMWAESGIQEAFLKETVRACEAAGIASPTRLGVDGTQILANAATVSLEEIPPPLFLTSDSASGDGAGPDGGSSVEPEPTPPDSGGSQSEAGACGEFPAGSNANNHDSVELHVEVGGRPGGKHKSGNPDWHGEKFSNATHRSTTDPEARLYRKGKNQDAKLRYLGHYLADVKSGVIYEAMATQATGTAEREATIAMLDRLEVQPSGLAMDLGYRDGAFLGDILSRGITPYVPLVSNQSYCAQSAHDLSMLATELPGMG